MAMTAQQLEWVRQDLGDVADAFTDYELNSNWDRLSNAPDSNTRLEAVKGMCFEQLLNNASKLHDYTAGAVDEKLSQVRVALEKRYEDYKPAMEACKGQSKQIVIGKVGKRVNPDRYIPAENQLSSRRRRSCE